MTGRPPRFSAAQMQHRIDVVTETTEQDEYGQPVVTETPWLRNEPAALEDVSGVEVSRGRQIEAGISVIFTVNYREGYSPTMRVIHDGITYGIVHVRRVDGMNRYRELMCKAVV